MSAPAYSNIHHNFAEFPSQAPSLTLSTSRQQNGQLQHSLYPVHSSGPGLINWPYHFTKGQFAGRTIRATLQEMQAPVFGRKTVSVPREAKVDRRPLDPPPVAWLRLFEVFNVGTRGETQTEMDYDNIHLPGLMCTVDLLTVPPPDSMPFDSLNLPTAPSQRSPTKATRELAGTTVVQADSIPWNGRTCLLVTFNDLAVKAEGFFMLQYRFFDLLSAPRDHIDPPIQAECCGAPFRVYSTRDAPALGKSTELCKHLVRYGVRLNVRLTERKRKHIERSVTPPYTTRKLHDESISDASDDDDCT
ncbi:velvet factor-domain-containing protein [Mycena leptocephala]|nr:velvet factor-domain-containing protein [Mycena leptocephala]